MKKLILLAIAVIILLIIVFVTRPKEKVDEPAIQEEKTTATVGEDLSNFFKDDSSDNNFLPIPTSASDNIQKCNIGDITVVEGTVIDGSTCIVE